MQVIPREELQSLLEYDRSPAISLFMPAHRSGLDVQQNPIRFKNLVREAGRRLERVDNGALATELLGPAERLLRETDFWKEQLAGLALFSAPGFFRVYRLPFEVEEWLVVARRFHIKPLLPLFVDSEGGGRFYVLALSQKMVRLIEGTRYSAAEVELRNAPHSLAEALQYDDIEQVDHFYPGSQGRTAGGVSPLPGHGVGVGDEKHAPNDEIARYFRQLDRAVTDTLRGQRAPLVLAGVEKLIPIYREVSTHPQLAREAITGNPQMLSADELRARAWPIVESHYRRDLEEAVAQYRQHYGTPRVSNNLVEIVPAAYYGRVGLLFLAPEIAHWGSFDPATNALELHSQAEEGDEDLLDAAAVQTLLHAGGVYPIGIEESLAEKHGPAVAVFRY